MAEDKEQLMAEDRRDDSDEWRKFDLWEEVPYEEEDDD